jgi:hypothetical protein
LLVKLFSLSVRFCTIATQTPFSTVLSNSLSTVLTSDTELGDISSLENIDPIDEAPSTLSSTVPLEDVRTDGDVPGNVLSTVPVVPLSQVALAKRFTPCSGLGK